MQFQLMQNFSKIHCTHILILKGKSQQIPLHVFLRHCFFMQNLYSLNATGYVIVSVLTFISLNRYQVITVVKIYHVPSMCKTYNRLSSGIVDVVQLPSCVQLFATLWTAVHQASLSFTISRSLLKTSSIESVMPSSHLILCCKLTCLIVIKT